MNFLKNFKWYHFFILLIVICAVFLRIYAFIQFREFDPDECHLALTIIYKDIFHFWGNYVHAQFAPQIFMVFTKCLTNIFGHFEWVYRIIPFIFSILNVFVFVLLSRKFLKSNLAFILANLLFAFNVNNIFYAQAFKQYSLETFVVMCAILFFSKFEIKDDLGYSKNLLYSIMSFIPLLCALPYAFVYGSFILYSFIYQFKIIKKIIKFIIPFGILGVLYYFGSLKNSQNGMFYEYPLYWQHGFVSFEIHSVAKVIKNIYDYLFIPNVLSLGIIFLTILGAYTFIKENKKEGFLLICTLIFAYLFSSLRIYPMSDRIILYQSPLLIILLLKGFDFNLYNARFLNLLYKCLLLVIFIFSFKLYITDFSDIFLTNYKKYSISVFPDTYSREITKLFIKNFDGEKVIYDYISEGPLLYYQMLYAPDLQYNRVKFYGYYPKGKCTFYFPHHLHKTNDFIKYIESISKHVYYKKIIGNSFIIKVEI